MKEKDHVLKSANKLFFTREKIISALKKGIFPYIDGFQVDEKTDEETDEEYMPENEEIDNTNMPELESEESAAQRRNQQGKCLKILTPSQMFSRLPISLGQLNAGNNSEKL